MNTICANGASCVFTGPGTYQCICLPGFTNNRCQDVSNNCANSPCAHGATCINNINSYTCDCPQGYTGSTCEIAINPCNDNTCLNGGLCSITADLLVFQCNCLDSKSFYIQ